MSEDPKEFSSLFQSAVMLHEMYTSLTEAGFTEWQAIEIIKASVAAASPKE